MLCLMDSGSRSKKHDIVRTAEDGQDRDPSHQRTTSTSWYKIHDEVVSGSMWLSIIILRQLQVSIDGKVLEKCEAV